MIELVGVRRGYNIGMSKPQFREIRVGSGNPNGNPNMRGASTFHIIKNNANNNNNSNGLAFGGASTGGATSSAGKNGKAYEDNNKIKHNTPKVNNTQNNQQSQQILVSETYNESQNLKKSDGLGTINVKEIKNLVGYLTASTKINAAFREGKMMQAEPACHLFLQKSSMKKIRQCCAINLSTMI